MRLWYLPFITFLAFNLIGHIKAQVRKKDDSSQSEGKQYQYIAQKKPELLIGGKPVSLNVQSARISDLIRLFQEKTGLNIISSDKIVGSFTAHVTDVPARDALRSILEVNNLYFIEDKNSNLIRIVTKSEYQDFSALNFVKEKIYVISVGKARVVASAIKPILTKNISRMIVDEKNNRIIISDFPERLEKISTIIEAFVSPPGQIYIECQIYEIELTDGYEFGFDWSVLNIPNVINSVRTTFIPRENDNQSNPTPKNQGLSLYRSEILADGGTIEGLMHLVAQDTHVESIASPKVLTQQNQKAEIHVGRQIPYNETIVQGLTGNQSSSFKFLDIGTKLIITPQITKEKDVQLGIDIEVSTSPGFIEFGAEGAVGKAPEKVSTSVVTNVLVKNGSVLILGGLIRKEDKFANKGVPLLKDIPILKYLFSYRTVEETRTETIIFIKPKITSNDEYMKIPKHYRAKIEQTEIRELKK